jgi:inner membrane transporter RhtA
MYAGAAVAVGLFGVVSPAGVAWLRCLGAALVLLAWRRPPRSAWTGRTLLLSGAFGIVTAGMNVLFYEALARLPLGTAVALEFAGPVPCPNRRHNPMAHGPPGRDTGRSGRAGGPGP